MKRKTMTSEQIFNELFLRYPQLEVWKDEKLSKLEQF